MSPETPQRTILTPAELNHQARHQLERGLGTVWIEGEVSNLAQPRSGHVYFHLKDDRAQVRCALFRQYRMRSPVQLRDGLQVLVRGRVSLYEPRGDYQVLAEFVEASGEGRLRAAFEALARKLESEGLFAAERKRPLPRFPRRLGIITSPSGAALHDVLSVLERRYPCLEVVILPSQVQGQEAPAALRSALRRAERLGNLDAVLLTRGGGSIEDLWAFNDESLARAIAASPLICVSAVGHEVDTTLCDLVADVRAPTPSAAAELLVPNRLEWLQTVDRLGTALRRQLDRRLSVQQATVAHLHKRLRGRSPGQRLADADRRLATLRAMLGRLGTVTLDRRRQRLTGLSMRLSAASPDRRMGEWSRQLETVRHRLNRAGRAVWQDRRQRMAGILRALNAVSPLAVLQRGYSVTATEDGRILHSASQVEPGASVITRLASGRIESTVDRVIEPED